MEEKMADEFEDDDDDEDEDTQKGKFLTLMIENE